MLFKKIGKASLAASLLVLPVSPVIAQRPPVQTHELRIGDPNTVEGVVRKGEVRRHVLRIGAGGGQLSIRGMKVNFKGRLTILSPTSRVLATSTLERGVNDLEFPNAGEYLLEIEYLQTDLRARTVGQYFIRATLERKTIVLGNDSRETFEAQLRSRETDRYVFRINKAGRLFIEDIKTNFSGELIVRERRDPFGDPSGGKVILTSVMNTGSVDVLIPRAGEYMLSVQNKPESVSTSAPGFYMFVIRLVDK